MTIVPLDLFRHLLPNERHQLFTGGGQRITDRDSRDVALDGEQAAVEQQPVRSGGR